jgi:hypothetical protein
MLIRKTTKEQETLTDRNERYEKERENRKYFGFSTWSLIQAVKKKDYHAALQAINDKANANVNISSFCFYEKEKPEFITPLQIAVHHLDFKIIKLLLENGADPNILCSNNLSILELILIKLGLRVIGESSGDRERYIPKFFELLHIKKEFSKSIKLNASELIETENILNLLLCYGLNPDPAWTEHFALSHQDLISAASHNKSSEQRLLESCISIPEGLSTAIEISLEEKNDNFSTFNKKILAGLGFGLATTIVWIGKTYKNARTNKNAYQNLNDYNLTCQNIKKHTLIAAEEIQNEYYRVLQPEVDEGLKYQFASVLIDLILQYVIDFTYSPDFSKQIYEKRVMERKIVRFWMHQDASLKLNKEDKERLQQRTKYEVRLNLFFRSLFATSEKKMSDENIKLISEYALTPK